ncbi:anthrone oxygenase family protein [Streptomyces bicolor]|uniref:anthrone oxygenase family protein n=1 Tax=Streptomyces bicolor TaxID=66874 RepID=UPI000997F8B6|nr:anthrone oxygenase family protein [Streptomyces bicolor]
MTRNNTVAGAVLGAATVAMGLIAGAFYVFACAVMPGLARSEDRVYVEVMRDINDVIQNPVFLLGFLGALVLTGVSAWRLRGTPYRRWVWAAAVAYGLAFLVTVAFNIPLNDGLEGGGDPGAQREEFEGPWVAWNVVRGVLSTVALGCLARALVGYGGSQRRSSSSGPSGGTPSGGV